VTLAGASDSANLQAFLLHPASPVFHGVSLAAEIHFS
jgi:hypothetical protein